ncbi:thermonuclease family protein [Synechococcus sp. BS56D]|uniref:thermonuclease family protein n=1 Tax=Synechococcus sp. BS56D TaxID=2055944 RepID=UPI001F0FCBAB|nr:thermonuclease family protein [Synechococcus sp. BS56D]
MNRGQALALLLSVLAVETTQAVWADTRAPVTTPSTTIGILAVNNGQELLVEINGQGRTLRLSCIQAPRIQQQPWAKAAKEALAKEATIGSQWQFQLRARDVHGRLVGTLKRGDRDLVEPLLREGQVFAYDGFLGRCDDLPYAAWQSEARARGVGIWSVQNGITRPWDLRERTPVEEQLAP